ncbi:2'-5' RNA ligase family protein [Flavobacterium terrisoli]|uniref:2'-5' RNA ligase family protein n=1 Tax=Flavobacterium terrisoli TaxID=3242195 RepID=UPI0025428AF4|nr:2'-5' RNA ligase family protein [Flavobacterium buctense]
MPKYSVAIVPSEEIVVLVAHIKQELSEKIGWFNSKNSQAHITILEFEANEKDIEKITNPIKTLCDTLKPIEVSFNHYDAFPNGAFFIAPTDKSRIELKSIMKQVESVTKHVKNAYRSHEPHISIGRRLDEAKLKTAIETFTDINFSFECDAIALRVFNENRKQFAVIEKFPFNDNPNESYE